LSPKELDTLVAPNKTESSKHRIVIHRPEEMRKKNIRKVNKKKGLLFFKKEKRDTFLQKKKKELPTVPVRTKRSQYISNEYLSCN
jgi:hypothetical protein